LCLIEYRKFLSILNKLPPDFHKNRSFKKANDKFMVLLKAARLWLIYLTNKTLPSADEIVSVSELSELSKLLSKYIKLVETKNESY
jgi:hypothetical protein